MDNSALDLDFLKKAIGEDRDFEKELFEIFLENSKYNISKLEDAISKDDNNAWYMASHALKGSSASIGAFNLSRILEVAQKNSDDEADAKIKMLEDIKLEFTNVEDAIKSRLAS